MISIHKKVTNILCLETSGLSCSVALSQNGECKGFKQISDGSYRHAEILHELVVQLMKECNTDLQALNAIAVSKGPGSYTGLRVGVSAAKGFAYGLNIPLIGINTLELVALHAQAENTENSQVTYVAMLDARREEVYLQEFDAMLNSTHVPGAVVFPDYTPSTTPVVFCGDGSEKAKKYYNAPNISFKPACHAQARFMCKKACDLFTAQQFEDVAYFEPFYLKDFYTPEKKA